MREKVTALLEEAIKVADKHIEDLSLAIKNNLPVSVNPALEPTMERSIGLMNLVNQCEYIKEVYGNGATTFTITWGEESHKDCIVVDICLYAPLAAIYVYGDPPAEILTCLRKAIAEIEHFELTKEEIRELEASYYYQWLF